MKRISIVGLGDIGLPTAILASKAGYEVFGFDVNHERVDKINAGESPFLAQELSDQLWTVLSKTSFKAYNDLQYADCFLIAAQLFFNKDKTADLTVIFAACDLIAQRIMRGNLVIIESTVPVGTTEKIAARISLLSGLRVGIDFFVAYCSERISPGKIFKELVGSDRVIGGVCQRSCELARIFYSKFVKGFLHITDSKTAEMVKLVENSHRDVQIAFANQVAALCEQAEIDPFQVIELANRHPKVNMFSPGCGTGGHSIAVDTNFLINQFSQEPNLLKTARALNEKKPQEVIASVLGKIKELKELGVSKPNVLALGLTYKPDVDDMRESPSLKIAREIYARHDEIEFVAYDHNINKDLHRNFGFAVSDDLIKSIRLADIIVVLVKHKEFRLLNEDLFKNKVIIDPSGLLHDIYNRQSKALLNGTGSLSARFRSKKPLDVDFV